MNPTFVEVKMMRHRFTLALAVVLVALGPSVAQAGPPLLCFPMSIGDAASLPWGAGGWKSPLANYDRARLADDTVALLSSQTRALVRMETLRRAVIYAVSDEAAAKKLFGALRARAQAGGKTADPRALFDLGYAVEAYRQAGHDFSFARLADPPEDGYARAAIAGAKTDSDLARTIAAHQPVWGSRVAAVTGARR